MAIFVDSAKIMDKGQTTVSEDAREIPNMETLEAFAELKREVGNRFSGSTVQLFAELAED